jgi:hypothetical protein
MLREGPLAGGVEDGVVVPRGFGDQVKHRLMAGAHMVGVDLRRDRLDTLALAG